MKMKIPSVVRKIGNITDENRIYIEDYVFSYFSRIKEENRQFPVRMALYGHACRKGESGIFLIYGASCVAQELQAGYDQDRIREEFFPEYSLIGYVNVYPKKELTEHGGYYIFYEQNEAMQQYLVSRYERTGKAEEQSGPLKASGKEGRTGARGLAPAKGRETAQKGQDLYALLWEKFLKKLLLCFFILVTAASVTIINDYQSMKAFAHMTAEAVEQAEHRKEIYVQYKGLF